MLLEVYYWENEKWEAAAGGKEMKDWLRNNGYVVADVRPSAPPTQAQLEEAKVEYSSMGFAIPKPKKVD